VSASEAEGHKFESCVARCSIVFANFGDPEVANAHDARGIYQAGPAHHAPRREADGNADEAARRRRRRADGLVACGR
jgi:hypothetical protein